jgi:anaerobic dimethyl sulfoxide reductase subunit B (iron-sulfur subunit)
MGFYFDQTRCTGCYTCSVACKDWHDIDAGPVNWMRVEVIEKGIFPDLFAAWLATPCFHCENPPCVQACPENAIRKREADGIVEVDSNKCAGSGKCPKKCLKACPWNAPQFGPEDNARMQKCDFCLERLEKGKSPICVEACPMYAIEIGPLHELRNRFGQEIDASGFRYNRRFKPSVVFRPKHWTHKPGPFNG